MLCLSVNLPFVLSCKSLLEVCGLGEQVLAMNVYLFILLSICFGTPGCSTSLLLSFKCHLYFCQIHYYLFTKFFHIRVWFQRSLEYDHCNPRLLCLSQMGTAQRLHSHVLHGDKKEPTAHIHTNVFYTTVILKYGLHFQKYLMRHDCVVAL